MQVENFEFDSLQLKLDSIQPDKIRRRAAELKTAALRLDALEESFAVFQAHADEATKSFDQSIAGLQKVCTPVLDDSCKSVDAYTFDVLNLTHQLSKVQHNLMQDRESMHRHIESIITNSLGYNWTEILDESDHRLRKFTEFQERAKERLQSLINNLNIESEQRYRSDNATMQSIGCYFVDSQRNLQESCKSTLDLKDILSSLAVSVAMQLRECKEERQPVQKLIYDRLSILCDHIRDNIEMD